MDILDEPFTFLEMGSRVRLSVGASSDASESAVRAQLGPPLGGDRNAPAHPAQERWSLEALHAADEETPPIVATVSLGGSSRTHFPLAHVQNIPPVHPGSPRPRPPQRGVVREVRGVENWQTMETSPHWQVGGGLGPAGGRISRRRRQAVFEPGRRR